MSWLNSEINILRCTVSKSQNLLPHVIPFFASFFQLFWHNEANWEASHYSSALIEHK